jgi:hypothetical protein
VAITYDLISAQTLASAVTTVTFSSIPQTYTDLFLSILVGASTGGNAMKLELNGDTASNYSTTYIAGTGTTAIGSRTTSNTTMRLFHETGSVTAIVNAAIINFLDYSNTTTYKTMLSRSNSTGGTEAEVNWWRSTAAITTFNCYWGSGYTFPVGSTFALYGVKAE